MSLQVWLPLNGSLENQGLSDVEVTNTSAIVDSNGKIGPCYSFGTGTSYLTVDHTPLKTFSEFSFACWVKIISWNTNYATIFAAKNGTGVSWYNLIFSLLRNGSNSTLCFNISNGTNSTGSNCQTKTLSLDTWYHIVCTYKSGNIKLYQDGVEVSSYNTSVIPNFNSIANLWIGRSSASYYQSNILLNDVRIYDECLPPLEVKRISQGLILHYPLDNNGLGNENLAIKTGNRAPDNSSQVEWRGFKLGSLPITTSETLTVSFDIEMKIGTAVNGYPYLLVYNTNYKGPHGQWIYRTNSASNPMIPSGNYAVGDIIRCRAATTFTTPDSFSVGSQTEDWIEFYSNYSTENEITITNIKVERGNKATPWVPAKADGLGNILDFNDDIEYDTSGYNHNGITTNGLEFSTETPRYITSTKFGTNQCIKASPLSSEVKTLSCWAKTTANKSTSQFMVADSASNMCITFYNGNIIGVFGTTRSTGSKSALGTSYKENEWNHFVVVKTGDAGERDIYCNGVKLTPISNDYWGSAAGFWVGTRNDSNALPFQGYISDVRAYVTAFTEEEVQLLYQNSAYISSNGTAYAHEFVEV